ncbi:MAG: efflux RND transporter periplasmic adaptor subunit [Cyclobacteriaceae bacterium]
MKSITTLTIVSVAITSLLLTGCGDKAAKLEKLKSEQATLTKEIESLEKELAVQNPQEVVVRMKDIGVVEIAPRKFDYYIHTQGMVESEQNILVSAKAMGVISSVLVTEGQSVVKGQVLAKIDDAITTSSIEEVKASLQLATTVYERQKSLWDKKIGTEIQYLQAKNNKESLEKRLVTLNEQLDMYRIKSPISGTVDAVNVKIGENASPGAPAFRVINIADLKVKANVSEAYVTTVKKGNLVRISFPDQDEPIEARVSFVGRNIDPLSRSFPVEVELPHTVDLRPSMTAVLRIIFQSEPQALCVPINVVQEINGQKVVYVMESDGKYSVARRKVIEVGGIYDNLAEVKSGLKAGDKVITVGYQGLNDGEFVKI